MSKKRTQVENFVSGSTIPREDMPRHIAYHEAGHAVMAVRLGIRVALASRISSSARLGHVDYVDEKMKPYHAILVSYAGTIAEQLGTNTTSLQGRKVDEEKAMEVAELIGFPDATRAIPEVLEILVDHWGAVEAVAQALLARERLEGAEVHEIVAQAPAALPPKKHLNVILGRKPSRSKGGGRRGRTKGRRR